MKKIITLFSILFLLTSCNNDDPETLDVQFSVIGQGDYYNGSYNNNLKANLVIKDQDGWNNLLDNMPSYSAENLSERNIDFTDYHIIAIIDEVKNSGGYSIDITRITETNNEIMVKIENLKKGNLTSVITQPFHIVKILKTEKKVVFK